jgi:hypothetical protein
MRKHVWFVLPVLIAAAAAADAAADPGTRSPLMPVAGQGSGIVEIAPTAHNVAGPESFDVQGTIAVKGLAPNARYKVVRWVDFNPDGNCTGTTPLFLPGDPTLRTSARGAGALHFEISRGAPLLDGVSFDVIWRVLDLAGNTILESNCLTVTVK